MDAFAGAPAAATQTQTRRGEKEGLGFGVWGLGFGGMLLELAYNERLLLACISYTAVYVHSCIPRYAT